MAIVTPLPGSALEEQFAAYLRDNVPPREKPRGLVAAVLQAQGGKRGAAEAFTFVTDLTVSMVYRYLFYCTGNDAAAKVLTTATYQVAQGSILDINPYHTDPTAWLMRIARDIAAAQEGTAFTLTAAVTQEDGAKHYETRQAVGMLTPLQQEAIVLRYVLKFNEPDIAYILGLPTAADALTLILGAAQATMYALEEN